MRAPETAPCIITASQSVRSRCLLGGACAPALQLVELLLAERRDELQSAAPVVGPGNDGVGAVEAEIDRDAVADAQLFQMRDPDPVLDRKSVV